MTIPFLLTILRYVIALSLMFLITAAMLTSADMPMMELIILSLALLGAFFLGTMFGWTWHAYEVERRVDVHARTEHETDAVKAMLEGHHDPR